jgi:hypothetical protein
MVSSQFSALKVVSPITMVFSLDDEPPPPPHPVSRTTERHRAKRIEKIFFIVFVPFFKSMMSGSKYNNM